MISSVTFFVNVFLMHQKIYSQQNLTKSRLGDMSARRRPQGRASTRSHEGKDTALIAVVVRDRPSTSPVRPPSRRLHAGHCVISTRAETPVSQTLWLRILKKFAPQNNISRGIMPDILVLSSVRLLAAAPKNHMIFKNSLKSIFADIDDTLCLDPQSVARHITSRHR